MDTAGKKASPFESEIHPSHKSDDLFNGYFAPAEGLYRLFGAYASHSIQRKMPPHFSIAAPAIVDCLCSGNCCVQLQGRTKDESRNGGDVWGGTALSRCRSCQMSREE